MESCACNQCGALLELPAEAAYVSCNYCQGTLAIRRTVSVTYTERIEAIDRRAEQMARQLAELAYQDELNRVDHHWDRERQRYLVKDRFGRSREPSLTGVVLGGSVSACVGLSLLFAGRDAAPLAWGGAACLVVGAIGAVAGWFKTHDFLRARRAYRRRRAKLTVEQFLPDNAPPTAVAPANPPQLARRVSDSL